MAMSKVRARVVGVLVGVAVGVLIGAAPLDGATAAVAPPSLVTGGYSTSALSLSTVTDTLPGLGALSFAARAGEAVVRTYTLTNHGEATIVGVAIRDPDAGGPVGCGLGSRGPFGVAAWSSVTCTVRFAAVAGAHRAHVVASGVIDGVGASVSASAEAGYFAAAPGLRLRESLGPGAGARREMTRVPIGTALRATYTLSNDGDAPLVNVSVSDSQQVSGLTCGAGAAKISVLSPGESRVCTAVLHAAAGLHNGSSTTIGIMPQRSISASGPGAPTSVEAAASTTYTGVIRPTMTAPTSGHTPPSIHPRALQQTVPGQPALGQPAPGRSAPGQTASLQTASGQTAPPAVHGQSAGSTRGHSMLPALFRRHHRAVSLLLILFVVALVPAVRYLVRRA
jgi:hypothetical protein